MGEKVTVMVLKVNDLQCPCCYKKVKKVLCKFPQIRDQVYDEKGNTVTITVVCCDPEKIRDKICCKGCGVIKSIEIKEPKKPGKPKEPEKPKQPEKPKEPEKPKVIIVEPKPKEPEKPKVVVIEEPKPKPPPVVIEKPKEPEKPKEVPKPGPPKAPEPILVPNPPPPVIPQPVPVDLCPPDIPVRTCCRECYEGYGGGPCYYGWGVPPPPPPPPAPPCYDGYYGYGYGRGCDIRRCDYYFSDDNPQSCHIM